MDDMTPNAFANREDPIPVVNFDYDLSDDASDAQPEQKRSLFKKHAASVKENVRRAAGKSSEMGASMQDRLLEK